MLWALKNSMRCSPSFRAEIVYSPARAVGRTWRRWDRAGGRRCWLLALAQVTRTYSQSPCSCSRTLQMLLVFKRLKKKATRSSVVLPHCFQPAERSSISIQTLFPPSFPELHALLSWFLQINHRHLAWICVYLNCSSRVLPCVAISKWMHLLSNL